MYLPPNFFKKEKSWWEIVSLDFSSGAVFRVERWLPMVQSFQGPLLSTSWAFALLKKRRKGGHWLFFTLSFQIKETSFSFHIFLQKDRYPLEKSLLPDYAVEDWGSCLVWLEWVYKGTLLQSWVFRHLWDWRRDGAAFQSSALFKHLQLQGQGKCWTRHCIQQSGLGLVWRHHCPSGAPGRSPFLIHGLVDIVWCVW